MPKKPFTAIQVRCRERMPVVIHCGGHWLAVEEILEHWRDTGSWWEGESEKEFFRILCREGRLCEIYRDLHLKQWFLYRIYD